MWESVPSLAPLLATAPGIAATVAPGEAVKADVHLPFMSLPHVLGLTLESIPAYVPYLKVPEGAAVSVSGTGLRVGLVWRGNPEHENDRYRSVGLDLLAPLFDVPGVTFFSLQVGADESDARMISLAPKLSDFAHTAAAVQVLDLVISVDTAVAHLAGALGKPVWILLAQGNDWRWLHGQEDSPWYPTARLFRQGRGRRWRPAIRAIRMALEELAIRS
jgi:hypothetical protein